MENRVRYGTPAGAPPLDWWNIPLLEGEEETRYGPKESPKVDPRDKVLADGTRYARGLKGRVGTDGENGPSSSGNNPLGAPPLDWWEIPPGGYEGAHYAVFPPELCVKPVKAMSPERVCKTCGEPSRRIVGEAEYVNKNTGEPLPNHDGRFTSRAETNRTAIQRTGGDVPRKLVAPGYDTTATAYYPTLGFSDCGHDDWRPGIVLDCFGGSGTTALVATGHGRDCILIDLDERNFDLALERVGPFILTRGEIDESG